MKIDLKVKTLKSERGMTLLEVMASAAILLITASVMHQMLIIPKETIDELEQKADVVDLLKSEIQKVRDSSSFPDQVTDSCSLPSACDVSACGAAVCSGMISSGRCQNPDPNPTFAQVLTSVVTKHPKMCYLHVEIDPTCGTASDRAIQVCARAEWPKKGNEFYEQAFTSFYAK